MNGSLGAYMTYQLAGGFEYNLWSTTNAFSGSFTIPDSEKSSFSFNTENTNKLLGNGSAAIGYALGKNQRLTTSVSVRGEAYTDKPTTNINIGYQVGF